MNDGLKQRLVGAFVLLALAIIFLPGLLREQQPEPVDTRTQIPDRPNAEPVIFDVPRQPDNIEPSPSPDTMFMPEESSQPVVNELSEAQRDTSEVVADREAGATAEAEAGVDGEADETSSGAWVVQVASFGSLEAANKLRDRLQDSGHKAYVRSATIASGEVSRVYIGPKLDRNAAEDIKAEIDRELRVEALVLRFQP